MKKLGFSLFIALISALLLCSPFVHSADWVNGSASDTAEDNPLDTLQEIFFAFTQGLSPDLTDESQTQAFEVYRCMKFGDSRYLVTDDILRQIADAEKKNPCLIKTFFRNYHIIAGELGSPITAELKSFSTTQLRRVSEVLRDLYQIDSNPKFWKKIFQYEDSVQDQAISKKDVKDAKRIALEEWLAFLETKISSSVKAELRDSSTPLKKRASVLYRILSSEREGLKSAGKDLMPISRALVDLVHTLGYQDPQLQGEFKSENGLELIQAFRKVLELREQFAIAFGIQNGFKGILKDLGVPSPSGVSTENAYSKALDLLEQGVKAAAAAGVKAAQKADSIKKIRHLSLEESPLRSCLGGDCATRSYLLKALDPNFHYFTLTDGEGASSGHVTLVAGDAKQNGESVKMVFIDKIQNVPNIDLPAMLEGIRLSVLEQGYILALPDDMGDHNGLSNEARTRSFVISKILVDKAATQKLFEFVPHANEYYFDGLYSRAYEELPCSPLLPLADNQFKVVAAEINHRWKVPTLNIRELTASALNLKTSAKLEERLRYIPTMEAFRLSNVTVDPQYPKILQAWIEDPNEAFQLRKQVLIYKWRKNEKSLLDLLKNFTVNEQIQIMQNLLDTPRHREFLNYEKVNMVSMLIRFRNNTKLKQAFFDLWMDPVLSQWYGPLYDIVFKAENLDETQMTEIIKAIYKVGFNGNDTRSLARVLSAVAGTGLEKQFENELFVYFISHLNGEASLGRVLAKGLTSAYETEQRWARYMLETENSYFDKFQVIQAFKEVQEEFVSMGNDHSSFTKAALSWLASEKVALEVKTNFLLANVGSGNGLYGIFKNVVPKKQLEQIRNRISSRSFLELFERLLEPSLLDSKNHSFVSFFNRSPLESFEFVPVEFPKEGKIFWMGSPQIEANRTEEEGYRQVKLTRTFEIQKTPVTELQWQVVMGKGDLPKFFIQNGENVGGREPKVSVARDQVQRFIDRLNSLQQAYIYRLPTEAEWEFVARAGTQTQYFFGDDSAKIGSYAWFHENSSERIHPVAKLKPNPWGLFDIYGNVYEMTQNHWSSSPIMTPEVDPQGFAEPSVFYVVRGGAYSSTKARLRSAHRDCIPWYGESDTTGFRLVRTPVAGYLPEQQ